MQRRTRDGLETDAHLYETRQVARGVVCTKTCECEIALRVTRNEDHVTDVDPFRERDE